MKRITFTHTLICSFTIALILFWLHSKISRKTIKIELSFENIEKYSDYFSFIVYLSIYMLIFVTFIMLITLYLKNKKVTENSLGTTLLKKLISFLNYINIFYRTYVILFEATSADYTHYIIKLAKISLALKKRTNLIIIFCFISLPRIIVIITLLIEIYFGALHYYFYSLLLLLIPLLFRIILFMLKDLGPRVLPELKQIVKQGDINENPPFPYETAEGVKTCFAIRFYLAPEHSDLDLDYVMEEFYYPALFIQCHIEKNIDPRVYVISKITIISYYLVTALGFAYILQF